MLAEASLKALRPRDEVLIIAFDCSVEADFGLDPRAIARELRRLRAEGAAGRISPIAENQDCAFLMTLGAAEERRALLLQGSVPPGRRQTAKAVSSWLLLREPRTRRRLARNRRTDSARWRHARHALPRPLRTGLLNDVPHMMGVEENQMSFDEALH